MTFSLDQQLECIDRELTMRRRVYAAWVRDGRMSQQMAGHEIGCMQEVHEMVRQARQAQLMTSTLTGKRVDADAIAAAPELADKKALVLYFETDADRDEMIEACRAAMPGARTVKVQ